MSRENVLERFSADGPTCCFLVVAAGLPYTVRQQRRIPALEDRISLDEPRYASTAYDEQAAKWSCGMKRDSVFP